VKRDMEGEGAVCSNVARVLNPVSLSANNLSLRLPETLFCSEPIKIIKPRPMRDLESDYSHGLHAASSLCHCIYSRPLLVIHRMATTAVCWPEMLCLLRSYPMESANYTRLLSASPRLVMKPRRDFTVRSTSFYARVTTP
jgi:hypothetical protein